MTDLQTNDPERLRIIRLIVIYRARKQPALRSFSARDRAENELNLQTTGDLRRLLSIEVTAEAEAARIRRETAYTHHPRK